MNVFRWIMVVGALLSMGMLLALGFGKYDERLFLLEGVLLIVGAAFVAVGSRLDDRARERARAIDPSRSKNVPNR